MGAYATTEQLIDIVEDMATKINAAGGGSGVVADWTGAPCYFATPRWLRFDPNNKRGVIIKANTSIMKPNGRYATYLVDTAIDLSSYVLEAGREYFIYINDSAQIIASTVEVPSMRKIGRVHTLCVDAGASLTMITPASPSSGIVVGDDFLVKTYGDDDADFKTFYTKEVTAVSAGTPYDVITCEHPLAGFEAGDILPESVFCTTFKPDCLTEDAMVYDVDSKIAVDVYLQSGTGANTRSAYNAVHTVSRQQGNHAADMHAVGKRLLSDDEFTTIALGSNEATNIAGSADAANVGGHTDTAGRRMISAIGVEDACGLLWQWTRSQCGWTTSSWGSRDGRGSFGQEYGDPYVLRAGGGWDAEARCGARSRAAGSVRSDVAVGIGGRGSSRVSRGI